MILSGVFCKNRSGVFSFEVFKTPLEPEPLTESIFADARLGDGLMLGLVIDLMLKLRS